MTEQTAPSAQAAPLPLAGIQVIELCQNLAGPFAAEILASLGADVLKVERPEGDDARAWGPPFLGEMAAAFHAINHGKHSITLDLKDPQALAWLRGRIAKADVLVQNMRPGALDEIGLDAASLRATNPRLVYCSLGAYGHRGPMSAQPGYEPIVQAFSGLWSVNGEEGRKPTRVGIPTLDLGSGVWAALGCIAALHRRHQTGEGGVVDTSLLETAMGWLGVHHALFSVSGRQTPRHRSGSPALVVFQSFETADAEIVVGAANDRLFAKLVAALGHPEWAQDPRYATNALRVKNKEELLGPMEAVFRSQRAAVWMTRLEAAGVPCAPVNDLAQMTQAEQVQALGILQPLPGTELNVVSLPLSFEGRRPPIRSGAPALGEHNALYGLAANPSGEG